MFRREVSIDFIHFMFNYKKVKKQSDNPFLNLYKLDAVDREGKVFDYYFVSRRDEEGIKLKTKDNNPEGIVVYAITDEESPRLLVIKEYRYPLDDYIYELPAGIIDSGEVAEQAAVREIKEETGYTDLEYIRSSFPINHHYYAFNKDKYFEIESTGLFFKLNSDKRQSQELDDDEVFDLATREADVAIRRTPPTQPDLVQKQLFSFSSHSQDDR
jgi:ADP-ribose pyrophosphatase